MSLLILITCVWRAELHLRDFKFCSRNYENHSLCGVTPSRFLDVINVSEKPPSAIIRVDDEIFAHLGCYAA
jgi:hypothetical protein